MSNTGKKKTQIEHDPHGAEGTIRGNRFRHVLDSSGLSRKEFARSKGCSSKDVANWIARGVPAEESFEAARILGTTAEYLCCVDDVHTKRDSLADLNPKQVQDFVLEEFTRDQLIVLERQIFEALLRSDSGGTEKK